MFGRCRDMTQGTGLGGVALFAVQCSLNPCLEVPSLLVRQLGSELSIGVPINAGEQVLMVPSLCEPVCTLLLGLTEELMLKGPPRFLEMHLIGQHEWCFCSGPMKKIMHIPSPLGHVGDGGCHGSLNCVPGVLLALEVGMSGLPGVL